ncbi:TIGR03668 family PPOX class F420-dependent oxidoreductase [Tengunoibacter tsumagoiensis]|uniref:PPOX class F420-dependent oxidoreductase n=1 Tax=Tengunoibacter tsumagoiensis TaxID=2014871 RepID=A0A401ZXI5_9CHLR|nr:TIGR03668 family PPOX class F420-dependent oxidoreductase [Tengunoibacter tsumagoiensis]GCE11566.1 PPOX class F420-dependent oxidoreductase [Tengunoibacter tsumagoiensis]
MAQRTLLTAPEEAFVQRQRVARLATVDEHGTPYLVPICYAYQRPDFAIALDEKPKTVAVTQLKRVRNILLRHEATLLIDQYSDDWSQLGYLQLFCHADLINPSDERHNKMLPLLRARYRQYEAMNIEQSPMILLTPHHITPWGPAISLPT